MADSSVAITAGIGIPMDTRTEASNGEHRQVVVIGDPSTNAGVAPVDVTNGLAVDVKALVPGTAAGSLGKAEDGAHTTGDTGVAALAVRRTAKAVGSGTDGDYSTLNVNDSGDLRVDGGQAHVVKVVPTVTAGAYTADDCMGGEMTVANAARISGGGGILTGITMTAEDDAADGWAANNVEVLIFDSNPAGTYTDNVPLDGTALTDADATLLLGTVLLDTYVDLGNITMLKATNVNIPYLCSGSTSLFAVAINRGGVTPEATDALQFTFHLIRD